jgi:hypothetical protein
MSSLKPELPQIPESERSALVEALREVIAWQEQRIDELEQEILKLKGETRRPKITPSQMDKKLNAVMYSMPGLSTTWPASVSPHKR